MINQSLEESAIGWDPPILLERDVAIVLSDDIRQDFEIDSKNDGLFGFNQSFDGKGDGDCSAQRHQGSRESIYFDLCLPILLIVQEASLKVVDSIRPCSVHGSSLVSLALITCPYAVNKVGVEKRDLV